MELNGTVSGMKMDPLHIMFVVISDSSTKSCGENFFLNAIYVNGTMRNSRWDIQSAI